MDMKEHGCDVCCVIGRTEEMVNILNMCGLVQKEEKKKKTDPGQRDSKVVVFISPINSGLVCWLYAHVYYYYY